jgi:hypothetical protein
VRNSGTVSADAVVSENGKVFFRRSSGAQKDKAGSVAMKASESLVLEAGSSVTADGSVAGEVRLESAGNLAVQEGALVSARGADAVLVAAARHPHRQRHHRHGATTARAARYGLRIASRTCPGRAPMFQVPRADGSRRR